MSKNKFISLILANITSRIVTSSKKLQQNSHNLIFNKQVYDIGIKLVNINYNIIYYEKSIINYRNTI